MEQNLFKNGLVLLLAVFLFSACEEQGIDSMFFRTDGALSATLKDVNNAAVQDAEVSLYNLSTGNRISVKYTSENGAVEFGRYEAGEYALRVEATHGEEWFSFQEEVHVISGAEVNHEINLDDHYGEVLVRLRDSSTGELLDLDLPIMLGFVPDNDDLYIAESDEELIELVVKTVSAKAVNDLKDIPAGIYRVILYANNKILATEYSEINGFDREMINFYVNTLNLLLESKTSWTLTSVSAETENVNLIPIRSLSFENNRMIVSFSNGETKNASYELYSNNNFYWYNLGNNTYNFYFNPTQYEINSDGSITFNFTYWETYNYSLGQFFYSDDVSLTFD